MPSPLQFAADTLIRFKGGRILIHTTSSALAAFETDNPMLIGWLCQFSKSDGPRGRARAPAAGRPHRSRAKCSTTFDGAARWSRPNHPTRRPQSSSRQRSAAANTCAFSPAASMMWRRICSGSDPMRRPNSHETRRHRSRAQAHGAARGDRWTCAASSRAFAILIWTVSFGRSGSILRAAN